MRLIKNMTKVLEITYYNAMDRLLAIEWPEEVVRRCKTRRGIV